MSSAFLKAHPNHSDFIVIVRRRWNDPHSAKVPLSALREVVTSVVKHANSLPYLMHLSYACEGVKP